MPKPFWIALGLILLAIAGLSLSAGTAWRELNSPLNIAESGVLVDVPTGTSLSTFGEQLSQRGMLDNPMLLTWYARLRGDATRIQAGEYRLMPGATPVSLLSQLVGGRVYLHQLTIVEGWRFNELMAALRDHPAIQPAGLDAGQIMAALGSPGTHPEGQFFPDTYSFPRGTTDLELLGWAHEALGLTLSRAWADRTPDLQLEDAYQALILASIVEKETALSNERERISGVFHRRLERGMRLQTDPTVIYGMRDNFDGNLRRRDLERDTLYKTYTRSGLPPTPIALAGQAAILAAVKPAASDALYFVATGEPDGSHQFSATLEEHNQAVRNYLQRTRERSR